MTTTLNAPIASSTPTLSDIASSSFLGKPRMALRNYQKEAVVALRENKRGIVAAATGSGKTTMMAASIAEKVSFGRVLVLVHLQDLVRQTAARIRAETGLVVGEYYADIRDDLETNKVMVATWQSMAPVVGSRLIGANHYHAINVDEAHHVASPGYQAVVDYFKPEVLHAFTATPSGRGEKELFKRFEKVIYSIDLLQLIDLGFLTPFHIDVYNSVAPMVGSDEAAAYSLLKLPFLRKLERKLSRKSRRPKILHFFRSNAHIEEFLKVTKLKNTSTYTTAISKSRRSAALDSFKEHDSETRHLLTIRMLDEGVDISAINGLVFHESLGTLRTFVQRLGRGLRVHDNAKATTLVQQFISPDNLVGLENLIELKEEIDAALSRSRKPSVGKLNPRDNDVPAPIGIVVDPILQTEINKILDGYAENARRSELVDCICGQCGKSIRKKRVHLNNLDKGASFLCDECHPGHMVRTSCTQCGVPVVVDYEDYRVCRTNGYGHRCDQHMTKRGDKKQATCAVCGQVDLVTNGKFNSLTRNHMNYYCSSHSRKHSSAVDVVCSTCGKQEKIADALYRNTWASGARAYRCAEHRRKFSEHVTVECTVCGKADTMMYSEYKKHWEKRDRPYKCQEHRKEFGSPVEVPCSICGALFRVSEGHHTNFTNKGKAFVCKDH